MKISPCFIRMVKKGSIGIAGFPKSRITKHRKVHVGIPSCILGLSGQDFSAVEEFPKSSRICSHTSVNHMPFIFCTFRLISYAITQDERYMKGVDLHRV